MAFILITITYNHSTQWKRLSESMLPFSDILNFTARNSRALGLLTSIPTVLICLYNRQT